MVKHTKWMAPLALVAIAACGGEEQGERVELGEQEQTSARASWPAELTARIDSANAAYANENYQVAADVFRGITEDHPDLGIAYFGLYMAETALGNDDAAQEALAEAEALSPGLARMHQSATDSAAQVPMMMQGHPDMPEGHPSLDSMMDAAPPQDRTGGE
ncbi:MAG: hypothetical protein ACOC3J_00360 [Gemmatimonadota bacterium]